MSGIKRRMSRQQGKKKVNVVIGAYVKDGELDVVFEIGNWLGGTAYSDSGLPDGELPWLAKKVADRVKQSGACTHGELISIADQVIKEEESTLLLLTTKGKSPP
ncbi:hypothetical protein ES703_44965 [subsurface metagenome]